MADFHIKIRYQQGPSRTAVQYVTLGCISSMGGEKLIFRETLWSYQIRMEDLARTQSNSMPQRTVLYWTGLYSTVCILAVRCCTDSRGSTELLGYVRTRSDSFDGPANSGSRVSCGSRRIHKDGKEADRLFFRAARLALESKPSNQAEAAPSERGGKSQTRWLE